MRVTQAEINLPLSIPGNPGLLSATKAYTPWCTVWSMLFSNKDVVMEKKHSGLGIVSFSISMIEIVAILVYVLSESINNADNNFIIVFATMVISLVAMVLSIFGLSQKDRKKLFAILGTTFSALLVCISGLSCIYFGIISLIQRPGGFP
jgi:hypothetical protein